MPSESVVLGYKDHHVAAIIFLSSWELKRKEVEKPECCNLQPERKLRSLTDSKSWATPALQMTERSWYLS